MRRILIRGNENRPALRGTVKGNTVFGFRSGLNRLGDHIFENDFKRHGMAASLVGQEKFTVTAELAVAKGDMVVIVVAMKGHVELVEPEAAAVFRVALGFLKFPDQTIVHRLSPFFMRINKKGTRRIRMPLIHTGVFPSGTRIGLVTL
jgi:hypothetical protein